MWSADPLCHWCGKETIYTVMKGGSFKENEATIDHVFSRYQQEMRDRWGNPVVLACYRCNHDRGAQETKAQPIEDLWKRAGHFEKVFKRRNGITYLSEMSD